MKRVLSVSIVFLFCTMITGQVLLLSVQPHQETYTVDRQCYTIELQNTGDRTVALSGQNYRLYYDASKAYFLREQTRSLLPISYGDIKVIQATHNVDASGFGNLEFDEHLGFVNFAIYDSGYLPDLVSLEPGVTLEVASMCYQPINDEREVSIVWARKSMTDGYATAYTEIQGINDDGLFSWSIDYQDLISQDAHADVLVIKD